ncbi:Endopolyphosphatase [Coemansia sp. RSA 1086]|nr:Endopolyphosphatase [Coemansia sp. RSA 1086]
MWSKETTALLHPNSSQLERRRQSCRQCTKSAGLVLLAVLVCSGVVVCMLHTSLNAANTNRHRLNSTAVGRFLHITDMHVDPGYKPGSTIYSQCHRYPPHTANSAATMSDGHKHTGRFGIPLAKCDSPIALINATSKYLQSNWADKLDFVIWTGDSGRHDGDPEQPRTFDQIIAGNNIAVHALQSVFGDSIPVVPNIGNNDISPHNELAAPGHKTARKTFEQLSHAWQNLVPKDQLRTFLYGGYFAKDVVDYDSPRAGESTGITALSLNTIYWYRANAKVGGCRAKDSPGLAQLAWIRYQMRRARARNRDLILLGHVLPNRDNYRPTCYHGYARTVTQVVPAPALRNASDESVIADESDMPAVHAQLFGHSNVDVWAFVGQEAKWISSLDPLGLGDQQNGSMGDNRLWWERQVDEETGRFGKMIRNIWEATSPDTTSPSDFYADERLWENMEDDPPVQFSASESSAEIVPISETTSNISAPQRLPSDFVETLLKEYKQVLVKGPESQQNLGVTTISPSIVPKYVPAFRIFHYLRKRPESSKQRWWQLPLGTLLDYDVYWADIARINKLKQNPTKFFTKLYRFSDVYKLDDLSLDSYLKWAEKLLSSKSLRKKFRSLTYLGT